MAPTDIAAWLRELGLERYEPTFRANDIDADVLPELSEADLERLGVSLGHRKKLLRAIADLQVGGTGPDGRVAGAPPETAPEIEGERRQVTVLFADLCGYTELSRQLDAEEVHALLERFFDRVDRIVDQFGGSVDKHIGDCVMAVFGAPTAHGNDAERAVRAALAIRDAMPGLGRDLGRALEVHIGLAAGQVVASRSGSATHREYTVTGDSVNLASRLTDEAARGVILISDVVRRMLPPRFVCRKAGRLAVRGLAEPVRAWQLLGIGEAATERPPFVGRRAELAQFEGVLGACRDAGTGQAVVVRGEAGIGKTRVVEEFQALAEGAGFACHFGLVLDFGAGVGQDAIRTLVRSLLGLSVSSAPAAAHAAAERALLDGLVASEQRVYLNDLLDLPQPTALRALYDAMDNATRNRGKRATVAGLVCSVSARQPLLLVVEDVHWADQLTLEHLAALAETVAACPALLVMTTRIEGDPLDQAWRSRTADSPLMTIDLGPLRPQEATALAGTYLDATAEFAQRCIERAAGNPLFLEQLLRHAEQSSAAGVPGSVQSLVQARMDQLDPHDKQALQAASVFGQRFALEALRHQIDDPDYDCAPLIRRFLIRPAGDDFLFAHALIRDAVYDSLLRVRRREFHLRAAGWFADRDLVLHAEHLDRAEHPSAPQAYLAAARAQAADYRYERARALTDRGLAIATDPADRFALTCLQGDILHDLGAMAESRAAYERALEAAADDGQRAHAWLGRAAVKRVTEDLDGAFADLDRAQAAAERYALTEHRARIHFLRGNLHFPRGDIAGCLAEHENSLRLAREIGSPELEAQALGGLGDAEYVRGRMISAHRHLQRCVELAAEHGLGRIEVANRSQITHASLYFQPHQPVFEQALAAAEAARRVGHHRAELNARVAAIFASSTLGELDRLRDQAEQALAIVRRLGARRFAQSCLLYLGKAALAEERREEAVQLLEEALAISRETGIGFHGPNVLGGLAAALPDPNQRRGALAEGEDIIRRGCVAHNQLRFYPDAIETALDLGDWQEAERYADALEAFTRPEPLPWSDFFIARGRMLAAVGRGRRDENARPQLERLCAEARRLELWMALPALDEALARL
jgi:class 3 adenylate cyclase/tetratricopeptide (TPR) repeat protein